MLQKCGSRAQRMDDIIKVMFILHGDNQIASREALNLSKKDALVINDLSLDAIRQAVESESLFGNINQVIIENIFSSRPSNGKKQIIEYLLANQKEDILIWESKDVTAQLREFSPQIIKVFAFPKYIFSFLDRPTIPGLHQVLQTMPPEQIFASLATRAHKQVNTKWLQELLDVDYKIKTGTLPYDLSTALELWCAKL